MRTSIGVMMRSLEYAGINSDIDKNYNGDFISYIDTVSNRMINYELEKYFLTELDMTSKKFPDLYSNGINKVSDIELERKATDNTILKT